MESSKRRSTTLTWPIFILKRFTKPSVSRFPILIRDLFFLSFSESFSMTWANAQMASLSLLALQTMSSFPCSNKMDCLFVGEIVCFFGLLYSSVHWSWETRFKYMQLIYSFLNVHLKYGQSVVISLCYVYPSRKWCCKDLSVRLKNMEIKTWQVKNKSK